MKTRVMVRRKGSRSHRAQSREKRRAGTGRAAWPERLVIVRVDEFLPAHTLYRAVCARQGEQPLEDLLRMWVRDSSL